MNRNYRIVMRGEKRVQMLERNFVHLGGFGIVAAFIDAPVELFGPHGYLVQIVIVTEVDVDGQHMDLIVVDQGR